MEDPYWRDNELKTMELMKQDWTFSRSFMLDEAMMSCRKIELDCPGLDTLCDIFINGIPAGRADNMHRHWVFDITHAVHEGENEISIEFHSPVNYIKERDAEDHWGGSRHAMRGFPYIRKAHCMFGWDWGPRLPDMGIWKDIGITGVDSARITGWKEEQSFSDGRAVLKITVEQKGDAEKEVIVITPDSRELRSEDNSVFVIDDPQLWWPNGLGGQPLYTVKMCLFSDGRCVDSLEKKIGLRTMKLSRKKDQWGESFAHSVNGVSFFAMGADYIPEDNILTRITPERTRKLLSECKAANFNVVRVWGGGFYPSDDFYDACDELGLVVWQDFMFACAHYPIDYPGFEENITEEIKDNVRRLRHHPSLGIWCGNNEMEKLVDDFDGNLRTKAAYIRLYEHIIPHILRKEDPVTPYWPSSPSSGGSFDDPSAPDRGDVHFWEVWHGRLPFSEYRKHFFRYVSEFGFQSFPSMATIKEFTEPEDRNIFSRVMETHQRNEGANGLIMTYISKNYLYPSSFDVLLYASQLLQAEAMKCGVEHWRRNRGRCMGAIYWQLNDIWPVASWASIDYFGRWKALHYFARRFFEPVHLSVEEYGESQFMDSIVQEPHGEIPLRTRLNVTNETMNAVEAEALWELRTPAGDIVSEGRIPFRCDALSAEWIGDLDFAGNDFRSVHLFYRLEAGGEEISSSSVLFTEPKYYRWADPHLAVRRDGDELIVTSSAYAKSVEIYSDNGNFILDDNFFDMEPGEKRVRILESSGVSAFSVRSVWDIM